jgi:predicted MFS family arabinose efflux permease
MISKLNSVNRIEYLNFLSLFILYFVQAMPFGFQSRYLPLIMRKQGKSLTSLGLFKMLLIPWVCKIFLAAFMVDVYKTKRFWLLSSMIVLTVGSFVGVIINDFYYLAMIIFILNWASATQDICVDWFAMNALKKENLGIGNTIQVSAFKLGTLFSGGLLVYLMDYLTVSATFAVLGCVYLCSLFLLNLSLYNKEAKREKETADSSLTLKEKFFLLHKSPGTYWICVFVILYKLGMFC